MASGSFRQIDVVCPFYRSDDGRRRIICEGLTDDGNIEIYYRSRTSYTQQIETFCCRHAERCEIYRAICAAKYMEDD